jgi:hypothetical protein
MSYIPRTDVRYVCSSRYPDWCCGVTDGVWESLSSWVKQRMSEGVHSPPSSVGDKNEWSYTFITCILLFIFITFLQVKDMWKCSLKLRSRLHNVGGEKV